MTYTPQHTIIHTYINATTSIAVFTTNHFDGYIWQLMLGRINKNENQIKWKGLSSVRLSMNWYCNHSESNIQHSYFFTSTIVKIYFSRILLLWKLIHKKLMHPSYAVIKLMVNRENMLGLPEIYPKEKIYYPFTFLFTAKTNHSPKVS